jgi:hypothetical protein
MTGRRFLLSRATLPVLVALSRLFLSDPSWAPNVAQAVLVPLGVVASDVGHGRFSFAARSSAPSSDQPGRTA